jgi:hypothetical protein
MLTDFPLLILKRHDHENILNCRNLACKQLYHDKTMVAVHFKWSSTEDLIENDDRDQRIFYA